MRMLKTPTGSDVMAFAAKFKRTSCEVTLNIPGGRLVMRLFLRNNCYRLFKLETMSGGSVLMLLLYMYNKMIETIAMRA